MSRKKNIFTANSLYENETDILTYYMSRDCYQLILFTFACKLHICVLLILFFAVSYHLFIQLRKTWERKYINIYFALTKIRIYPKSFFRRSTLTFMPTSGKEKVNIVAAGLVSIIYCIQRSGLSDRLPVQIKQVNINRLQ